MNNRILIGSLMVVSLLMGCATSVASQPAVVPAANEDAQAPEQEQDANPAGAASDMGSVQSTETTPEIAQPASTADIHCTQTDPHPVAQGIAETYHTTYEEVMTFFCDGVGFDDIVLGYQTAELSGRDVKEVLTLWYDFGNWDDVWKELGLE